MEPAIEVATLVMSYLWALRDIFPEKLTVSDLNSAELGDEVARVVGRDVAWAFKLAEIAWRRPDEHWRAHRSGDSTEQTLDSLLLSARLARRVQAAPRQKMSLEEVRRQFEELRKRSLEALSFGDQVTSEDLAQATKQIVRSFSKHAEYLVTTFGTVTLRVDGGSDIQSPTREESARSVAEQLLRGAGEDLLVAVPEALDYRPLLLRALDGDGCRRNLKRIVRPESRDPLFYRSPGSQTEIDPFLDRVRTHVESDRHQDAVTALLRDPHYPAVLTAICDRLDQPVPFPLVLHRELDEIALRRGPTSHDSAPARQLSTVRAYNAGLLGVCLSGGGIRSATFNLGVLQSLANRNWLPHIDYLSTVSGGGYIGSWLLAWIKRRGSSHSVQDSLRGLPVSQGSGDGDKAAPAQGPDPWTEHVRPIRMLREYSNYLAPSTGFFSADLWTMCAIWARNTSLNLLVLALFLMGALMVPRFVGFWFNHGMSQDSAWGLAAMFFWSSAVLIGLNLNTFGDVSGGKRWLSGAFDDQRGDTELVIILTIVVPAILGGACITAALLSIEPPAGAERPFTSTAFWYPVLIFALGIAITSFFGALSASTTRGTRSVERTWLAKVWGRAGWMWWSTVFGTIAASVGGLLMYELWANATPMLAEDGQRRLWMAVAFGPSAVLAIITAMLVLYLGLEGQSFNDERREWWSRLGAWFGLLGGGWVTVAALSARRQLLLPVNDNYFCRRRVSKGASPTTWRRSVRVIGRLVAV